MTAIRDFQGFLSLMGLPTLPGRENQYLNPNNFNTPHRMIEFNLYWEWKAIEGYVRDRDKAMSLGDMRTAELFTHIMGEEEEHFEELLKRYNELVSGLDNSIHQRKTPSSYNYEALNKLSHQEYGLDFNQLKPSAQDSIMRDLRNKG